MSKIKKICVITGSRAEYGLLKLIMKEISEHKELDLQILATGSHLSSDFGNTYLEIEEDGFFINKKIPILHNQDSSEKITQSIADATTLYSKSFKELAPDMLVVLGDRYEIFAASFTAYISNIPIAHIHGGEVTEGAYDEAFRHSITKMSYLHFVTTDEYMRRVIQLGEEPDRVFNYGAPGIEAIKKVDLLGKQDLINELDLNLKEKNILVTYHPETLNSVISPEDQIEILLNAIDELEDINFIFTKANADTGGMKINQRIQKFVEEKNNCTLFSSLGQKKYLSLLQYVDGVVGNSSSGIIEVPSFKIGTVNIGNRQKGRVRSSSVIDSELKAETIKAAILSLFEENFRQISQEGVNPYEAGETSKNIVSKINELSKDQIKIKSFYDLSGQGL